MTTATWVADLDAPAAVRDELQRLLATQGLEVPWVGLRRRVREQSARWLTTPVPGGHPAWVPSWSLVWVVAEAMTRKNRQFDRQNDRQFAVKASPRIPRDLRSLACAHGLARAH